MIRILFLSLLTLTLSCGNTHPVSVEEAPPSSLSESATTAVSGTSTSTITTKKTTRTTPKKSLRPHKAEFKSLKKTQRSQRKVQREAEREVAKADKLTITAIDTLPAASTPPIPPTEVAIPVEISMPRPADIHTPETTMALNAFSQPLDSVYSPRKMRFLPMKRRMNREINRIRYVHKGEVMMGLTASYGTLNSEDSDMWLVIDNINLDARVFTVNPFIGYFFRDNMAIGGRFGYSDISGHLGSIAISLDDINLSLSDITLKNTNYSFGLFLRSYAGIDPKGHFGLFGELELSMQSGTSEFSYMSAGKLHQTFGDNTKVKLSFNPGMAVYIFPNVCATISFGLGGFQWVKTTQKDAEGNITGKRSYSNMRFRLNITEIRIGMTIHLWNKKKAQQ